MAATAAADQERERGRERGIINVNQYFGELLSSHGLLASRLFCSARLKLAYDFYWQR